ncbi:hypothetical protein [Rhizobiales bacterium]
MTHQPKSNTGSSEAPSNLSIKRLLEFLAANGGGFATVEGDGFEPLDQKVLDAAEREQLITRSKHKSGAWEAYIMTKRGYAYIGVSTPSRWTSFVIRARKALGLPIR